MGEMGVQVCDAGIRQDSGRQVSGLEQMLGRGRFAGDGQMSDHFGQAHEVAPRGTDQAGQIGGSEFQNVASDCLRDVVHPGPDALHGFMGEVLPGVAHGQDPDAYALLFQQGDLIGNKRL